VRARIEKKWPRVAWSCCHATTPQGIYCFPGFLEAVYQEGLGIEFGERGIPFEREKPLPVYYKGQRLVTSYRADFVCHEEIVVEIKALCALTPVDMAQIIHELKGTGFQRALRLNFGAPSLQTKRIVWNYREEEA
jgi:GxxExxY protein